MNRFTDEYRGLTTEELQQEIAFQKDHILSKEEIRSMSRDELLQHKDSVEERMERMAAVRDVLKDRLATTEAKQLEAQVELNQLFEQLMNE